MCYLFPYLFERHEHSLSRCFKSASSVANCALHIYLTFGQWHSFRRCRGEFRCEFKSVVGLNPWRQIKHSQSKSLNALSVTEYFTFVSLCHSICLLILTPFGCRSRLRRRMTSWSVSEAVEQKSSLMCAATPLAVVSELGPSQISTAANFGV